MTAFLGVLYLLVFLAAGCTCVRFLLPQKSLLTRVWLGVSLGLLLMMWLPALIAFAVDFTWTAHLLALIPLAGLTAGCFFLRDPSPVKKWDAREKQLAGQMLMVVLPLTLGMLLLAVLGEQPSDVTCNILYYLCGLVFTLIAMWRFLRRSFDTMVGSILRCLGMMFAAYGIDVLLSLVLQLGTSLIGDLPVPNNDTVSGLAKEDYKRMIAVAVLMAPLVEECLFRGVVFGTIRPKSRFWAYAASIALFSLYHVWQYVVMYGDPKLLLSALAYVPVSAALTFCYEQTRSIWPPVFFHMCINALSLAVLAG